MKIIKEYVRNENNYRFILRTQTYAATYAHFTRLYEAAKKNFPDLSPERAEFEHYGGSYYKGTYGLEFNMPLDTAIPGGYDEVSQVEYTL